MSEDEEEVFDPFGLRQGPATDARDMRKTTLGAVAKENAIVRRRNAGVGKDGLLDADREEEDEDKPGFRPGTGYRPL